MRTDRSILYNSVTTPRGSLVLAKTQAQVNKSTKSSKSTHEAQTDNLPSSEIKESNVENANTSKEADDVVWVEKEVKLTTTSKRCLESSGSKSPKRKKTDHSRSR